MEIEPALGLNDFAGANLPGRARNRPADLNIVKARGQMERVRKQPVA